MDNIEVFPDTATQGEVRSACKAWLKRIGKDYNWLAEKIGKTRSTLANYMAQKPIPNTIIALIRDVMIECRDGEPTGKRTRRTREQMQADRERELAESRSEFEEHGGDLDAVEAARAKARAERQQAEYNERMERSTIEERAKGLLDGQDALKLESAVRLERGGRLPDDPEVVPGVPDKPVHIKPYDAVPEQERVRVEPYGSTFVITLPSYVMEIYRQEAKFLCDKVAVHNADLIIPRLIARAIVEDVRNIAECDTPYYVRLLDRQLADHQLEGRA